MRRWVGLGIVVILTLTACRGRQTVVSATPPAPDYAEAESWYIVDRAGGVDLFYITSTETGDYVLEGRAMHYADVSRDSLRSPLLGEMQGVDALLGGDLNFFAPYYRQCTLETFTSDSLVAERLPLAMSDIRRAFDHYLHKLNNGRPFILAGFSQGAIAVVELLKTMDSSTFSRLAAAYVIGWKVTDADLAATPYLRAAQDSADVGVTVCYNSVRAPECAISMLSSGNHMAINPVNWRTDATPARLADFADGDSLTVTLDTASLLLLVDGYARDDYQLPLIGREGNYHRLEISLYASSLRRNMALRAAQMLRQKAQ